jgi:hypothetical protein
MDSREIVQRTVDYEKPDRVAHSFGESDMPGVECTPETHATDWQELDDGRWERIDEWGNIWQRLDKSSKGEVKKGVLEKLDDIHDYQFPDYSKPGDYEVVKKAKREHPDKWIMGLMPGFAFNIARKLRKLDQYLMDIITDLDQVRIIHDRIDTVLAHMIENYAKAGADSVFFLEDWGTQQQLMINPKLWREEFFPRYQKLCSIARDCGTRVFMHSCGNISSIIPGVMEAGVKLLQFDQPDLYGIDNLAAFQEMGRITFWCPVDIQKTLQTRDEKTIREKAREMLDKLWKGRGGYVAGYYEDNESIGLDPKVQGWASDEFMKYGAKENFA